MNNFPSCFRRGPAPHRMVQGQGGGKPANRRSPLRLVPESRDLWTAPEEGRVAYYADTA